MNNSKEVARIVKIAKRRKRIGEIIVSTEIGREENAVEVMIDIG